MKEFWKSVNNNIGEDGTEVYCHVFWPTLYIQVDCHYITQVTEIVNVTVAKTRAVIKHHAVSATTLLHSLWSVRSMSRQQARDTDSQSVVCTRDTKSSFCNYDSVSFIGGLTTTIQFTISAVTTEQFLLWILGRPTGYSLGRAYQMYVGRGFWKWTHVQSA